MACLVFLPCPECHPDLVFSVQTLDFEQIHGSYWLLVMNDFLSVDLQYTMLSGQVPFQSSRSFRSSDFIMQRITQGDIRFEGQQWESISPAAKELIKGILYKIPYEQCNAVLNRKFPGDHSS